MEHSALYDLLNLYKTNLTDFLNKIHENILQAMNSTCNGPTQKYQLPLEMSQLMHSYIKMLHECEIINETINSMIRQSSRSPSFSNPFTPDLFPPVPIKNETNIVNPSKPNPFISETNEVPSTSVPIPEPPKSESCKPQNNLKLPSPKKPKLPSPKKPKQPPPVRPNPPPPPSSTSTSEGSIVLKLKKDPVPDRLEEAAMLLEDERLKKQFEWKCVDSPPKKVVAEREETRIHTEISSGTLHVGERCIITHIESPSEFYVCKNTSMADSLSYHFQLDMNKYNVVNKYKTKTKARSRIGNFCGVFLPEEKWWHRVEVLDWMEQETDVVLVQLIDRGTKIMRSYKDLKSIGDIFFLFTKQAIRCSLAGIYPPGQNSDGQWPQSSTDFFIKLCEMEERTEFVIIFVHNDEASSAVDLRRASDPEADCLGELLVNHNHAVQEQIPSHDLEEDFEDLAEEYDNINEAIAGYDAHDEARICPFSTSSGGCFKGPSCKLEHGKLAKDGITTDKVLTMYHAEKELELPAVDEVVEVLITGYIDTCHFYAHILNDRREGEVYNHVFHRLLETMATKEVVQSYEGLKMLPGLGELVLIKDGDQYLRARCADYVNKQEVELFLVDMGYKIARNMKELRQIKEDWLYVPFQAVECLLDDFQEKPGMGSQSREFFDKLMQMKAFRGMVLQTGEPLRLRIWDSNGISIGHVLHQFGLGEERTVDLYPVQNSVISCQ